jgi:methylated-DNA-[protein]-cysteine S-methyltransferase
MNSKIFRTSLGFVAAASEGGAVCAVVLPCRTSAEAKRRLNSLAGEASASSAVLERLARDLRRYFRGERVRFRYRLAPANATPFRLRVWRAASKIPRGKTLTYSKLASSIRCRGFRAVGGALNANPTPILVPCHRVVSRRGLGGFAAGGHLKRKLLQIEGALA